MDLNSDMGEYLELIQNGTYESLMNYVTSINIACGGHAGDERIMKETISIAREKGIRIGAHPSYPDLENFGRLDMDMNHFKLKDSIFHQINLLIQIAQEQDIILSHVKAHGALYNRAANDPEIAKILGEAILDSNPKLFSVGLAGSRMLEIHEKMGLKTIPEAFADRIYEPDGKLRNRKLENSIISNPQEAAKQAVLLSNGKVMTINNQEIKIKAQTICIHSDHYNALKIAKEVSIALNCQFGINSQN